MMAPVTESQKLSLVATWEPCESTSDKKCKRQNVLNVVFPKILRVIPRTCRVLLQILYSSPLTPPPRPLSWQLAYECYGGGRYVTGKRI